MRQWHGFIFLGLTATLLACSPVQDVANMEEVSNSSLSATAFASIVHPTLVTRCASCHGASQDPKFAVSDVDAAYAVVTSLGNPLADLATPANSKLVTKIKPGNHNGIAAAVGDEIQGKIQQWSDALKPPKPTSLEAFTTTLYPVLTRNCAGTCHNTNQSPLFAAPNVSSAFGLVTNVNNPLANLVTPANSRLVVKVNGGHQGIPTTIASEMQNQIQAWANLIK